MIRVEQSRIAVSVVQDGVSVRVSAAGQRGPAGPPGPPGDGSGGGVSTQTVQSMINAEVGPTAPDPTLIFDQYLI